MLAALGFLGFRDIHRMNRLKALANVAFNAVASIAFAVGRHVDWRLAGIMASGAIVGGYGGAGIARAIGRKNVKRTVIVVGCAMGASSAKPTRSSPFVHPCHVLYRRVPFRLERRHVRDALTL